MLKTFSFDPMKTRLLLSTLLVALVGLTLQAQQATSTNFTFKKQGGVVLNQITEDYSQSLFSLEAPSPGSHSAKAHLAQLKEQIPAKIYREPSAAANKKAKPLTPFVLRSFQGNPYKNGVPMDNSMAISKGGKVVSVINNSIFVYDADGTKITSSSLAIFADTLKIIGRKFDPRVIYDPDQDRFILTYLAGSTIEQSMIILAFSKTNDPSGEWNLYSLPGNPLDDESWSDYPMISITKDEFFLTMNLLKEGGSWQTSFKQTVIWQVNKKEGYDGDDIKSKLWSDINFDGKPIRNLHPVKGGSAIYGPNMYFLSNRNFSLENDSIFFLELTGKQDQNGTELNIDLLRSDSMYGVPPLVNQPQDRFFLQTNDARVLDAFLEDDQILFVSNSVNFNNNFGSVYFGHISNVSTDPTIKAQVYESDVLEFGYPGIAFTGDADNMNAIICMNHSSNDIYPGCGVVYYDGGAFSDYKYVKEGTDIIKVLGGSERWGDYIGMQPVYGEIGKCWMAGTFGKPGSNLNTEYGTWIAEIQKYGFNSTPGITSNAVDASVYPNPVNPYQWVHLEFEMPKAEVLSYSIYDIQGKEIELLMRDKTKQGRNLFTFDASALESGTYFIKVSNAEGFLFTEQFIVR